MKQEDFPFLSQKGGSVYLDSAATTLMPEVVIARIARFYRLEKFNPDRGLYKEAERATELHRDARATVARFIGAERAEEVVFTAGATDGMNLLAEMWGNWQEERTDLVSRPILIYREAHNSSLVPWLAALERSGFDFGMEELLFSDLTELQLKIARGTSVVVAPLISHITGTVVDIKNIIKVAHRFGAAAVVDATQAVGRMPVNVRELDADFLVFSGHKMYGPMGIGALYFNSESELGQELLQNAARFGGGAMSARFGLRDEMRRVYYESSKLAAEKFSLPAAGVLSKYLKELPAGLEPGTRNLAGEVGLAAAIEYLERIGLEKIRQHEQKLTDLCIREILRQINPENLEILGWGGQPGKQRVKIKPVGNLGTLGIVALIPKLFKIHPHDIASLLAEAGFATRAGLMCAGTFFGVGRELMTPPRMGSPRFLSPQVGALRVSFGLYNTEEEVRDFVKTLGKILRRLENYELGRLNGDGLSEITG